MLHLVCLIKRFLLSIMLIGHYVPLLVNNLSRNKMSKVNWVCESTPHKRQKKSFHLFCETIWPPNNQEEKPSRVFCLSRRHSESFLYFFPPTWNPLKSVLFQSLLKNKITNFTLEDPTCCLSNE